MAAPRRIRTAPALAAWARVVGAAAMARALPVWAAVAVVAGVLLGGNGIAPATVTGAARAAPGFAAGLALTWLVLIAPAARAALDPRATAYLRALPVPRWRGRAVTAAALVAIQAPWALLWGAGEGVAAGAAAAAAGAAAAAAVAAAAGRIAWPHRTPRWGGPVRAVVGAHARLLRRGRGAAVARAVGVAWLGGAAAGLVARASELDGGEAVWWALAVGAVALPVAVGALAAPVAEADRRLGWLLVASGCGWPARVAAAGVVLGGLGAALGLVAAAGHAVIAGAPAATAAALAGWLALLGAGIGGLAVRAGAWAAGDGTRVVIAMLGAAAGALGVIGALGAAGAVAVAAAGASAAVSLASPRRRPEAA